MKLHFINPRYYGGAGFSQNYSAELLCGSGSVLQVCGIMLLSIELQPYRYKSLPRQRCSIDKCNRTGAVL